jgi:hypothetical protein
MARNATIPEPGVILGKAEDNFRSCNVVPQETRDAAGGRLETLSRAIVARRGRRETPREPNDAMGQTQDTQLAARAAKAAATREARGTTSKKQKLAVKGNVTGVTVTPVTAPSAAPSPSAQPASPAPAAAPTGTATK